MCQTFLQTIPGKHEFEGVAVTHQGYAENVWRRAQLVKRAVDKGRKHIPNVVLERLYVLSDQTQAT